MSSLSASEVSQKKYKTEIFRALRPQYDKVKNAQYDKEIDTSVASLPQYDNVGLSLRDLRSKSWQSHKDCKRLTKAHN